MESLALSLTKSIRDWWKGCRAHFKSSTGKLSDDIKEAKVPECYPPAVQYRCFAIVFQTLLVTCEVNLQSPSWINACIFLLVRFFTVCLCIGIKFHWNLLYVYMFSDPLGFICETIPTVVSQIAWMALKSCTMNSQYTSPPLLYGN